MIDEAKRRTRLKYAVWFFAFTIGLVSQACTLTQGQIIERLESVATARISTSTQSYCSNERFEISWDGGDQLSRCGQGGACKTATLTVDPPLPGFSGFTDDSSPSALNGSAGVTVVGIDTPVHFEYTVRIQDNEASDSLTVVPLTEQEISYEYEWVCENHYWALNNPTIEPSRGIPRCITVTQICEGDNSGAQVKMEYDFALPRYILDPDRPRTVISPGVCLVEGGFDSYYHLNLDPEREAFIAAGAYESCDPGDEPPGEPVTLTMTVECGDPFFLEDRQCDELLAYEPSVELTCHLEETCGDGTCDGLCETADTCSADCQFAVPAPGLDPEVIDENPDQPPPPELEVCALNGGINWGPGQFCACDGTLYSTYGCNDDPDHAVLIQGGSCTPDPSQDCDEEEGGSGGESDVCDLANCGDGICQLDCGEDSMSCAADCFG